MILQNATAANYPVLLVQASDHITGLTGATLTITASKNGGAFASIAPTVTEIASGWYTIALTAAHTDTNGALALHVTAASADPVDVLAQVVAFDPYVVAPTDGSIAAAVWAATTRTLTSFGTLVADAAAAVWAVAARTLTAFGFSDPAPTQYLSTRRREYNYSATASYEIMYASDGTTPETKWAIWRDAAGTLSVRDASDPIIRRDAGVPA